MNVRMICTLCALVMLTFLAACNEQDTAGSSAAGTSGMTAVQTAEGHATDNATPDESAAESAGTTVADASSEVPADTAGEVATEPVSKDDVQLAGKWFALFGMHDEGVDEAAWRSGQELELNTDGTGKLKKSGSDDPLESMFVSWREVNGKLMLSFAGADAVTSGLCRVAPLGIGRDEETGLLPLAIGRDEETGLLNEGMKTDSQAGFRKCSLEATLDGDYLALRDDRQRLMVYGRQLPGAGSSAPDLSGEWVGHIDMHDNFPATFVEKNGIITGTYEHDGGRFTGEFYNGFIIGKIEYSDSFSMAALQLTEEYELDGVYVPSPFLEMVRRFNFNRYSN